jgi:putative Holliday junction resolvase
MTKPPNRLLGIDYGSKRVGVAVSDPSRRFALPVSVIQNTPILMEEIEKIAVDHETKEIVLGESKNYKGEPNDIMLDILAFKELLEAKGYKVYFEPEFMTSAQAERIQGKNDMSDASAAALILQSYLDHSPL